MPAGHEHHHVPHNGTSLRPAAALLLVGQLLFIVVTQFHVGGDANDHPFIFAEYADSNAWEAVHALQFGATALFVAGLCILSSGLEARAERSIWPARLGAILAIVSLSLYGVLQAVDGIGNKQADQAWVNAPAAEKPARFASAESMRWLEWGISSYHAYALGIALICLAMAIAERSVAIPRAVSLLVGLSGFAYLAKGWVAGTDGFTGTHSALIVASWVLNVIWATSLAVLGRSDRR